MHDARTLPMAAGWLHRLPRLLTEHEGFDRVVAALGAEEAVVLDGVWGSSCALAATALVQAGATPLVVVCPDLDAPEDFRDDLALFSDLPVACFPAWESDPGERIIHDEIFGDRLRTLKRLASSAPPPVLVTSIQSLLQPVPTHEKVAQRSRMLTVGQTLDDGVLTAWLAERGFHGTSAIELPGEFCSRGGIIDIFAPDWEHPVRVELFGDRIESIRRFDVNSQRSLAALEAIEVTTLEPDTTDREHLTAYLPPGSRLLLVEPQQLETEGHRYLARLDRPQDFHGVQDVMRQVARFGTASAWTLAPGGADVTCRLQVESVERFSGDIERVREELDGAGRGHEVMVVCLTEAEVERLGEILASTQLAASGRLHFSVGRLKAGFRLAEDGAIVISSTELFQRTAELRRAPRRHLGKTIDNFLDLREGELVVHLAHGIGRYRGLKLLAKDDRAEEHLTIEFRGGTKVYVPTSKIELVQKYVGPTRTRPRLARIGGRLWERQKEAAQAAVTDLAADMLQLQAERRARPGIRFGKDTNWQREFDAAFPYPETADQLEAMGDIKGDMQQPRPMDRLLCGDVGFGKTELAIRAAFKAVDNGHQVGVLVPTTILAEQHFRTFRERMAEFPFEIAKLSRFSTPKQQRETVQRLRNGTADIVIGTHRLASRDVGFDNLGLLIIDEEQRFGVEVKERLKSLRASVDVLTLTATPIPRTLHMALLGLRDISSLATPPEERMAVETRVTRFDKRAVRHAVMRELNRGGQVFFVHNRVYDIHQVAQRLAEVVPEARICVGHGQMPEGELERVMIDFVSHQFDVLLATTIVESGLDIPNANTIFIDDADCYGLADLHQLRGRVGRYKHRAYCYLLIDPRKHITPTAAKRLRAIEEYSEMGAGFAIAMRDLEIRGAGNILGTQQSGHIAMVGYELYCQMLETAVRAIRRMPPQLSIEVDVDLPGEAFIPGAYVPDVRQKIDLYRRLSRIADLSQLADLIEEMNDRFGRPPEPVRRMISLAELRIEAAVWQIDTIHLESPYIVFTYTDRTRADQLERGSRGKLRVVDDRSLYLTLHKGVTNSDAILKSAKSVLQPR